jgi:signal transduction histidine kinase
MRRADPPHTPQITNAVKFEAGLGVFLELRLVSEQSDAGGADCGSGGDCGKNSGDAASPSLPSPAAGSDAPAAAAASASASAHPAAPPPPTPTHALEARVTDHGRGLSARECERVFDAYEATSAAAGGGTGLGLFRCAHAPHAGGMCVSLRAAAAALLC